jgi:hemerythrin-like domain-containing protein
MLTATYTLVALSVEQANVRVSLESLQKQLETNFIHQSALTPGQVAYACDVVKRLYESCHWRKLDMFLIPAIRNATGDAEELLHSLEELGRCAADAVGVLAIKLGSTAVDNTNKVAQFCAAIESFSAATLKRLELEEKKLFPVARSVISGEAWFSIANQMLAHDAYVQETRPGRHPQVFREQPYEQARQQRVAANLVH